MNSCYLREAIDSTKKITNKTTYKKNDKICCITKEKWLKDEWGNGDSDFI